MQDQYQMITAEHDGLTVTSSEGTEEELRAEIAHEAELQPSVTQPAPTLDEVTKALKETAPEVKPQPRTNPEDRVRQATGEAARYKRELEQANVELARLRTPAPVAEKPAEKAKAEWARFKAMPGAPKLSEFEGESAFEDYMDARAAFIGEKLYDERRAIEQQSAQKSVEEASEMEHYQGFQARLRNAETAEPGFIQSLDPVLTETPRLSMLPAGTQPNFGNWLVEMIYRAEPVKELLKYFNDDIANGKKEAHRLATMHPRDALREFARLEARLTPAAAPDLSTPAPKPKPVSQAKPPIRVERGSAQVGSDQPPGDDASDAEHEAYYAKVRSKYR